MTTNPRPRKHTLPLTYTPKINPVKDGDCTQTIRIINHTKAHPEGNRKEVGDYIRFFTWTGRPYRSKRVWVLEEYKEIVEIINIWIFKEGLYNQSVDNPSIPAPWFFRWGGEICCDLAKLDGIIPPTGEALRDVLIGSKIPEEGVKAQILRWRY